VVAAW